MRFNAIFLIATTLGGTSVAATQFERGDWAAAKIGNRCFVYTQRAAPDTSGTLIFSFENNGLNASFQYEYTPWYGETGAPWDEADTVVLEIDNAPVWLGEEMWPGVGQGGYSAAMTAGFVPEMLHNMIAASETVTVSFERSSLGETWVYGIFSADGFLDSLQQASEWCAFDPHNLPRS